MNLEIDRLESKHACGRRLPLTPIRGFPECRLAFDLDRRYTLPGIWVTWATAATSTVRDRLHGKHSHLSRTVYDFRSWSFEDFIAIVRRLCQATEKCIVTLENKNTKPSSLARGPEGSNESTRPKNKDKLFKT